MSLRVSTALLLPILLTTSARADVQCPAEPPRTEQVTYTEVWRTDAYSDDYLMGNIQAATLDDEGGLYLLDVQQQEVFRFGPTGEYLGTIVRQGEGPGEINQVWSIDWWSPNSLVLPQAFPPKVVRVTPDGVPQDQLRVYLNAEEESPASVTEFAACGDHAVVGGTTFIFTGGESSTQKWLGVIDRSGKLRHKLGERSQLVSSNPLQQTFNEFESFWEWDRWAVSADGRLFSAPAREEYVIAVHDLDGRRLDTWTRPIPPRERTKQELQEMKEARTFVFNGQKAEIEFTLSDFQPPIGDLHCFGMELWVRLDQGPDPESFARVAVHGLDGTLLAERTLDVPHDRRNDIVLLLDGRHIAVIENGVGAQASQFAAFSDEEVDEELSIEPIEVVLYRADPPTPDRSASGR